MTLLPTPKASDGPNGGPNQRDGSGRFYLPGVAVRLHRDWVSSEGKDYGPAVRRWESITGYPAPDPTEAGTRGNRRLSPAFEEWMMGLTPGHVTAVPDIPRRERMRMLGNGAVPLQLHHAYTYLLTSEDFTREIKDDMDTTKQEKPRGDCTGCKFEYQLGTARTGEFKGQLVVRKHNSRTGPGLCDGAQKPPRTDDFADPAPAPEVDVRGPSFRASYDSMGSCGHAISEGDEIRADGEGDYLCADCSVDGPKPDRPQHVHDDGNGGVWVHEGTRESCAQPECGNAVPARPAVPCNHQYPGADLIHCGRERGHSGDHRDGATEEDTNVSWPQAGTAPTPEQWAEYKTESVPADLATSQLEAYRAAAQVTDQFADPAPVPAELPAVSGQPDPDRDRWGRYMIMGKAHTRATTFAKLGSSTFALGEWNERMLIKGLTQRPDLLAMAHGLDVKQDRARLNAIADDAQTHAGNKVAANIGTAYHAFTEQIDAGLIRLEDVPEQWRERCRQYVQALGKYGLTTRREWIERTTAVRADQVDAPVPVAGTLDRIFQLPNGELVIGDLKTSSNIEYGWVEIAVQLALYAHGVNTHGLFDWATKSWQHVYQTVDAPPPVRTDYAIVVHLPADGDGCYIYRVDLTKGWEYAKVSGRVQSRQKDKSIAAPLTVNEVGFTDTGLVLPKPEPITVGEDWQRALFLFDTAESGQYLQGLFQYATESNRFSAPQLAELKERAAMRWALLHPAG